MLRFAIRTARLLTWCVSGSGSSGQLWNAAAGVCEWMTEIPRLETITPKVRPADSTTTDNFLIIASTYHLSPVNSPQKIIGNYRIPRSSRTARLPGRSERRPPARVPPGARAVTTDNFLIIASTYHLLPVNSPPRPSGAARAVCGPLRDRGGGDLRRIVRLRRRAARRSCGPRSRVGGSGAPGPHDESERPRRQALEFYSSIGRPMIAVRFVRLRRSHGPRSRGPTIVRSTFARRGRGASGPRDDHRSDGGRSWSTTSTLGGR